MNRQRLSAVIVLATFAVGMAGCTSQWRGEPPQRTTKAPRKPAAAPVVALNPGCPLGSTAVLGLNIADRGCNASYRLKPAGPIGSPTAP